MIECNPVRPTSDYNRLIAAFLAKGGVVKYFGHGVIQEQQKPSKVTPKQSQVMNVIRKKGPITQQNVSLLMKRHATECSALLQKGLIRYEGFEMHNGNKRQLLVMSECAE